MAHYERMSRIELMIRGSSFTFDSTDALSPSDPLTLDSFIHVMNVDGGNFGTWSIENTGAHTVDVYVYGIKTDRFGATVMLKCKQVSTHVENGGAVRLTSGSFVTSAFMIPAGFTTVGLYAVEHHAGSAGSVEGTFGCQYVENIEGMLSLYN